MDGSCELERRLIGEVPGLEVKQSENGRTVIRGYAAVFESESQDLGGFYEIVERGAFDEVMKSNPDVFGKYNHERVIGRTTSGTMRLMVDERGLRYEIDPPRSAADVVELIERGDVRGSSFAFRSSPKDESWQRDASGRMIRRIKKFSFLGDAGPVDTPAYLATETYVSKRALEMANDERAASPVVEDTAEPVPAGGAESVAEVPLEGEGEKRAAPVMYAQGDFVAWDGGVGRIEHIMEEGQLGEYSEEPLPATPDDPAVLVKKYEHEDGYWEESDEYVAKKMSELVAASGIMGEVPAFIDDMPDERAVSLKPTAGMAAAAKRGLRLHEEGKSGDGLKPETVARANRLARREEMNPEWLREMNAWFARHESASKSPGWDKPGEEKPGFVAWLLWGGTPAKNWAARKVKQMEASDRSIDYVGKAAALKSVMLSTHLHTK
jgi:HK97 family phage prohead protease